MKLMDSVVRFDFSIVERPSARALEWKLLAITLVSVFLTALVVVPFSSIHSAKSNGAVATRDAGVLRISALRRHNKDYFLSLQNRSARRELAAQVHYTYQVIQRFGAGDDHAKSLAEVIVFESTKAGISPFLTTAVIMAESTFNPNARSHKGALGLMQLLPNTGRYISRVADKEWKGSVALQNPEYNVSLGLAYLGYLLENFSGNLEHALIAYNWGPGNLDKALRGSKRIPGSPTMYADKIIEASTQWQKEYSRRKREFQYLEISQSV